MKWHFSWPLLQLTSSAVNISVNTADICAAKPLNIQRHYHLPLEHRDSVAIDDELSILLGDLTMVTAMGGVVLEHVDLGGRRKIMGVMRVEV